MDVFVLNKDWGGGGGGGGGGGHGPSNRLCLSKISLGVSLPFAMSY